MRERSRTKGTFTGGKIDTCNDGTQQQRKPFVVDGEKWCFVPGIQPPRKKGVCKMKSNIRFFQRNRKGNNCKSNNYPPPTSNSISDGYTTIAIDEKNADKYYLEDGRPNPDCYVQAVFYLSIIIGANRPIESVEQMATIDEMIERVTRFQQMAFDYRTECYKRILRH